MPETGPTIAPGAGPPSPTEPDGEFTELASPAGRGLSTEVAGDFTSRVIGTFASAGSVHFGSCDHAPIEGR